jgi:hypothetical protein
MKTRSRIALTIGCLALGAGCAEPPPTRPLLSRLTAHDVIGEWNIAFLVDSVRDCSSICRLVKQSPVLSVTGSLIVSDQYDTLYPEYLTAQLQVDFQPVLGRQVTCLGYPQASLVQLRDSGAAYFWFTPGSADCGLGALGQFDGSEFRGTWSEPSFTGLPLSSGSFRMWRRT